MKKTTLLLALLCYTIGLYAQGPFNKPDYKIIEQATTNATSEMYYPKLLQRYKNNDTTLNISEFRMLYFGTFFQEQENSFGGQLTDAADSFRAYRSKETLTDNDYRKLLFFSDEILKDNPFDLRTLYSAFNLHLKLGDTAKAYPYLFKVRQIVKTIVSTGDGLSEKTAFHVLNVSHEYFILNALGYKQGGGQRLTPNNCDYLSVEENEDGVEGLYFDVSQIFAGYSKMFEKNPPTLPKTKKAKKKKKTR